MYPEHGATAPQSGYRQDIEMVVSDQRLELIERIDLFRGLPEQVREALAGRSRVHDIERSEFLFIAGQPAHSLYALVQGHVKVVREMSDGQEVILRLLQPGEIIGPATCCGEEVHSTSAITLSPATVLLTPANDVHRMAHDHPEFALALVHDIGERLREADDRIAELQAERAERRVARALLRLASKAGKRSEQGIEVRIPLSRQNLAEYSGTTLTTVSRILSSWDREGLIVAGRQRVTIINTRELALIAEDLRHHRAAPLR